MLRTLWRLTRGYRLRPWRSPYLRWRMETYWGIHADKVGCAEFWWFTWRHRKELRRYFAWAARMDAQARKPRRDAGEPPYPTSASGVSS